VRSLHQRFSVAAAPGEASAGGYVAAMDWLFPAYDPEEEFIVYLSNRDKAAIRADLAKLD
jgi:hypothetical protein